MSVSKRIKAELHELNRLNPNITLFIAYGLLYDVFLNMYKPFAIKFLERLGGTEFHIALFNSLPGLSALVLLPGALIIGRRKSKKVITSIFFLMSRFFILMLAFVPSFPPEYRPLLFIAFIALMNLPEAVAQTSLQSFLGSIFNGRVRAEAISMRNKFGNIAVPMVTLMTGLIIGLLPKNDAESIQYYQIFYGAAFIVSLMEISIFIMFKEQPEYSRTYAQAEQPRAESPKITLSAIGKIFTEPKFLTFLLTTLIFQFTWQAGWPLSAIYQIKTLHAHELWLAAFAVSSGLCSFLTAGFWNKLIYKRGNSFSLTAASFAMAINMFAIALAPNLPVLLLVSAFGGFATIGVNCTLLNGMLDATPNENRIIAIAIYNTFVNISLFTSPFLANALLERFGITSALMIVATGRVVSSAVLLVVGHLKKQSA